ncbi:MAG: PUA domain-containing protein [Sulfolobales archaeon]
MIRIKASRESIRILRALADYQFKPGVGEILINDESYLLVSKTTGRIRGVEDSEGLVLTVRASDHRIIPTCVGGLRIKNHVASPQLRVIVINEISREISLGGSVFARHVLEVDRELRPWDIALVVDESDRLLAIGRLLLSPDEMLHYIRGVAVFNREGCWKYLEKVEM